MAQRVGILGGTFDPIHNGHLAAARAVADALTLDQVLLIPAGNPWQKDGHVHCSSEDRYNMALLATISDDRLDVSRIEVDRDEPTYTCDTLHELRSQPAYANVELFFITGADALAGLPTWREYPDLLELATFVGVTRPGHELDAELPAGRGRIKVLLIPQVDISSTTIRRRLADGLSIAELTPPEVVRYIRKRRLYQAASK